jgi:hypothetical protein
MSEDIDKAVLRAQVETFLQEIEESGGRITIVCDPVSRKRIRDIGIDDRAPFHVSNLVPPNTIYLMSDEAIERLKEQDQDWSKRPEVADE